WPPVDRTGDSCWSSARPFVGLWLTSFEANPRWVTIFHQSSVNRSPLSPDLDAENFDAQAESPLPLPGGSPFADHWPLPCVNSPDGLANNMTHMCHPILETLFPNGRPLIGLCNS